MGIPLYQSDNESPGMGGRNANESSSNRLCRRRILKSLTRSADPEIEQVNALVI
ncbi:hypothetical protein RB2649 [Rhodopirellula baltica SH 1]|uniref:Uncharacterized protein n=1 Tax=Rhodopirellula baltica (strain DSM 10527 / NCIMB 13988 / SH1) TaxID=243090 RepID=Q7UVG6_RHOBA|nr:hypothetical protein RB2649 [Rhodopirellula baltica SH 1]